MSFNQQLSPWQHPIVGQDPGVGGRYINYANGVRQHLPAADVAGKLYWYGKFTGNMYKDFKPGASAILTA
jgi:hypothetical protein